MTSTLPHTNLSPRPTNSLAPWFVVAMGLWLSLWGCRQSSSAGSGHKRPSLPPSHAQAGSKKAQTKRGAPFTGSLEHLYGCLIANAKDYLFCKRESTCHAQKRRWSYSGQETGVRALDKLGIFVGGTYDFYHYTGMDACLLEAANTTLPTEGGFAGLEALSRLKLHLKTRLKGFTRYNSELIAWAAANLIPKPDTPFMGTTYRYLYHAMLFRAARLFAHTYFMLAPHMKREAHAYKEFVTRKNKVRSTAQWLRERYLKKTGHLYSMGSDRAVLTGYQAAGFWLRRHIDGTERALARALHKLLKLYDPEFLQQNRQHLHSLDQATPLQ